MRSSHQAVVGLVLLLASAPNVQSGNDGGVRQSLYKFGSPKTLKIATIEGWYLVSNLPIRQHLSENSNNFRRRIPWLLQG